MTVQSFDLLDGQGHGVPLGTSSLGGAWSPSEADGEVDLAGHGYIEREYLVTGTASTWSYDDAGRPTAGQPAPYTTRVLVRRPAEPSRHSGVLLAEPLHPLYDQALAWKSFHPWLLRTGAAWTGITQDPHAAASMAREFDPGRYRAVSVPAGTRYQVVADVLGALRNGPFADELGLPTHRLLVSGWSATGSFWRVFLGEGFHERLRQRHGSDVIDGYLICISSGGAGGAGYPALAEGGDPLPLADRRRTIQAARVPVIELLSELESETHATCLRPDSDHDGDHYRLYQVAGTSHDSTGPSVLTNAAQYRRLGLAAPDIQINEMPGDGRLDYVGRAALSLLSRWAGGGPVPPRAPRFTFQPAPAAASGALRRDEHGNVTGGIRPPWLDVPVARYGPHSTPVPGPWHPSRWAPMATPEQAASMRGHMEVFGPGLLRALYGSFDGYLRAYAASCDRLADDGFLLDAERESLLRQAAQRRRLFTD